MLVVTIEIWPGGREAERKRIGEARLTNVSELSEISDYECEFSSFEASSGREVKRDWGHVCDFDRRRGFWHLLWEALSTVV